MLGWVDRSLRCLLFAVEAVNGILLSYNQVLERREDLTDRVHLVVVEARKIRVTEMFDCNENTQKGFIKINWDYRWMEFVHFHTASTSFNGIVTRYFLRSLETSGVTCEQGSDPIRCVVMLRPRRDSATYPSKTGPGRSHVSPLAEKIIGFALKPIPLDNSQTSTTGMNHPTSCSLLFAVTLLIFSEMNSLAIFLKPGYRFLRSGQ